MYKYTLQTHATPYHCSRNESFRHKYRKNYDKFRIFVDINLQFIRFIMRLRNILIAIIAMATISTAHCHAESPVTNGVDYTLAQERKANISDVNYDINFIIPRELEEDVLCDINITFTLHKRMDVVIDFRDTERIQDIIYNQSTHLAYYDIWSKWLKNEHIVIPRKEVTAGKNTIHIRTSISNQSLNRNDEYLYTLLVPDRARTVFPCFDQPDMKATYTLSLLIPEEWTAVSNTAITESGNGEEGWKWMKFAPTEPLSTYLFSFVAGKLHSRTYDDGTHRFTAYYRETDPKRLSQLDTIFKEVKYSIEWLEDYTGIKYPFAKYDFIMLPGFQYGGMEHTGATLYNASQMFLGDNPTLDELLRRSTLIAHETAHMWFGDYVTMRWFDDVWTKEVFANYFAARIVEPLYPSIDHSLSRLKSYTIASLSEDRTLGSTPIRQELDNLQNAGLIYGRIIYNKAPIVMDKIVEIMGEEAYREGIRCYLRRFGYGNATWPELIEILNLYSTVDLRSFSEVWVHNNAMPIVECESDNNRIIISQQDPLGREIIWPQNFSLRVVYTDNTTEDVDIKLKGRATSLTLNKDIAHIIPNICGRGYGLFTLSKENTAWLLESLPAISNDLAREATLINLHELYKWGEIDGKVWLETLINTLSEERNYLIASTLCDYIAKPLVTHPSHDAEQLLLNILTSHPNISLRHKLTTTLAHAATSQQAINVLYELWQANGATWLSKDDTFTTLSDGDAMTLAYELSIRMPHLQPEIIATQRARITNPDRIREFDFIARGTSPNEAERDALFELLLDPAERRTEPWAAALLKLLNHHTREAASLKYIYPGLEEVTEVQQTGDIFFPTNWTKALLSDHHSTEARQIVERFLSDNPDYPSLLRSKILQSADIVMIK